MCVMVNPKMQQPAISSNVLWVWAGVITQRASALDFRDAPALQLGHDNVFFVCF